MKAIEHLYVVIGEDRDFQTQAQHWLEIVAQRKSALNVVTFTTPHEAAGYLSDNNVELICTDTVATPFAGLELVNIVQRPDAEGSIFLFSKCPAEPATVERALWAHLERLFVRTEELCATPFVGHAC